MNSTFTPKQNELIDVIKVYPYETKQIVYAEELGVTPGRVCYMIKQIREKYTLEEFRDLI
jgi:hypothetical protein